MSNTNTASSLNFGAMGGGRSPKRRRRGRGGGGGGGGGGLHPGSSSSSSNAHYHSMTAAEERFLQQAIQNSKLDKSRPPDGRLHLPSAPIFFPTVSEFEGNPLDYMEKIRPVAERYGICKIVPPRGWNPAPFCVKDVVDEKTGTKKRFQTKLQQLSRLQEGISFGDGQDYSVTEYQEYASQFTKEWKAKHYPDHDLLSRHSEALEQAAAVAAAAQTNTEGMGISDKQKSEEASNSNGTNQNNTDAKRFTPENLERDYWELVEAHTKDVQVEYGNDVDSSTFGSGFPLSDRGRSVTKPLDEEAFEKANALPEPKFGTPEYYKETYWNLNNIPAAPDSAIRHLRVGINGINVPWMYYGSLFTTFCWHNEDNYMYSINYHHRGAPKQWYGVPGTKEASDGLEKVFKSYLSMKMRDVPDLLHHITTMFSPRLLQNADVPVYRLLQYEGEFVVTFPRAFHGGFSYGPNAGEAVNFATHDWIHYGADANERYRSFARPAVFSHDRLTFTMANHLKLQKAYSTCKLLLEELERVAHEELERRAELLKAGVRDVSNLIQLPKNRLDQLDERSASYDDKRLCHACRHICFFSAVACECSQSKVSCLRHTHYMCRCPTNKKYFMIWSPDEELQATLKSVRSHCETLRQKAMKAGALASASANAAAITLANATPLPKIAVGSMEDKALHKDDEISTGLFWGSAYQPIQSIAKTLEENARTGDDDDKKTPCVVSDASAASSLFLSSGQSSGQTSPVAGVEQESALCVPLKGNDNHGDVVDDDDDEVEVLKVLAPPGGPRPDC